MNLKKIFILITSALVGFTIVSCGGEGNNSTTITPQKAPTGPISYQQLDDYFGQMPKSSLQGVILNSAGSGCGGIMSNVGTLFTVAAGFLTFIPDAGPAIGTIVNAAGAISGAVGASAGNNCTAQTLANQQYTLALQESQIVQLNNQMAASNNIIWSAISTNSQNIAFTSFIDYKTSTQNIVSSNGIVASYLQKGGFWQNGSDFSVNTGYNVESLFTNVTSYTNLLIFTDAINQSFNSVADIVGVKVSSNGIVSSDPTSTLMVLYTNMSTVLQNQAIEEVQNNNPTNLIQLIQDYNNSLAVTYQTSLMALNALYQVTYLNNQINYMKYAMNNKDVIHYMPYLSNLGSLNNTYYNPKQITSTSFPDNESGQAAYYNSVQQNLTQVAAQMANQLYLNTLGYIVTDPMTAKQLENSQGNLQYTSQLTGKLTTAETVNYSGLGVNVESATALIINAIGKGLTLNNSNYQTNFQTSVQNLGINALFYQYGGINNIVAINNQLQKYNQTNSTTGSMYDFMSNYMPSPNTTIPAMITSNGSLVESAIASTATIQPYFINNGLPQLMGSVTNNIAACNGTNSTASGGLPGYNFYIYTPNVSTPSLGQVGTPYLMCGNWSTAGMPTQITNNNTTDVTTYYPGLAPTYQNDTAGTLIIYSNLVSNSPTSGNSGQQLANCLAGADAFNTNLCGNFPTSGNNITLTNFNAQNWAGSNQQSNSFQFGANSSAIFTGWMTNNYPSGINAQGAVTNLAAAQITLPDGFIAPIVLTNININGWKGNYIGIGYNPNVESVTIDGKSLLDGSNNVYSGTNSWGVAPSTTQASYNGSNGPFLTIPAIQVNNNTIMMNSNAYSQVMNKTGVSYITINPTSCPNAWSGPFIPSGGGTSLLPTFTSTAGMGLTDYQVGNFVCELPIYGNFFGS